MTAVLHNRLLRDSAARIVFARTVFARVISDHDYSPVPTIKSAAAQ
jgi:hypothetical protein